MNTFSIKLLIISLLVPGFLFAQGHWNCHETSDGIVVQYQADTVKNLYKVRIESVTKTDMKVIYNRLLAIDKYPELVSYCSMAKIISKKSENDIIYTTITDTPFPLKDREVVVEMKSNVSENEINIVVASVEGVLAPNPKYDRVNDYLAAWIIKKTPAGTSVKMTMQLTIPGFVPEWIKEQVIFKGPLESYINYTKQ